MSKNIPSANASAPSLWEAAVALPLFHTLTYAAPEDLTEQLRVGLLVQAPVRGRLLTAYLLGPAPHKPGVILKNIQKILDPAPRFGPDLVPLIRWLADYYHYPVGEVLHQIIPKSSQPAPPRQEIWAALPEDQRNGPGPVKLSAKAQAVLNYLREVGPAPVRELGREFPKCQPLLKRLATRHLLTLTPRPAWRDPLPDPPYHLPEPPALLSSEQQEARAAIVQGLESRAFAPFLLHGVTASGKTEVYLAATAAALTQGRQVLVLLPEIALTHPVAQQFRRRFSSGVTILHSGLTDTQRLAEWRRLMLGEVDIVVGVRSAVFAPLPRLGLGVGDEEHDAAYKNEGGLPYQARDVAVYRGKLAQAAVILASATPTVTTFYRAQTGTYRYLNLAHRVTPQALPRVELVNLKQRQARREFKIITPPLAQAITDTLGRGEQTLLFLNRRGYATVIFCLFCGRVCQCAHCSVALTQNQARGVLVCHYCGYEEVLPTRCPQCQSSALKRYGVGTEKVEAEVRRRWPQARVARLDRDTAPHSGRALKVLEDFAQRRLDILVGTQMIAKGHHFPGVTLVGIVAADLSLFFPEYHAGERTFQLLAQVAGRAGRGEAEGTVLLQTYPPEHYVFRTVQTQDYQAFYEDEIKARQELGYPPFTRLALARLTGPVEDMVAASARRLADDLRRQLSRDPKLKPLVRVLGPAPAGLAKLKDRYRWQLLLKSYGVAPLHETLHTLRRLFSPPPRSRIDLTLDIDPAHLF